MSSITKNIPKSPKWASTRLVEQYEQQTAYILSALGEINEDYKYSLITDRTTFGDYAHNPHLPIDQEALKQVSDELGITLTHDMTLVEVAQKMFEKKLDYRPK